jgi:hypothetical protein
MNKTSVQKKEKTADNFKGIFHNFKKDLKFYEGGAHFPYSVLCKKLEVFSNKQKITDESGRKLKEKVPYF